MSHRPHQMRSATLGVLRMGTFSGIVTGHPDGGLTATAVGAGHTAVTPVPQRTTQTPRATERRRTTLTPSPTGCIATGTHTTAAVGIHKTEFRSDDWADDRPDELNSGHELVDRSEKRTAQGEPYYEYKPAAVLQGEKQVSREVRMWLDKLGLLQPPDDSAEINVNIHDAMLKGLKEVYED